MPSESNLAPSCATVSSRAGQAVCGLVHDLANLLQTVLLRTEVVMATEELDPKSESGLEKVIDDGKKCAELLRALLEEARASVDALAPRDIRPLVDGAVRTLCPNARILKADGVHIADEPLFARVDPAQITDLVCLILGELTRINTDEVDIQVRLTGPRPSEGADHGWVDEEPHLELAFIRTGAGTMMQLEDGVLPSLEEGRIPAPLLGLVRARGIIRQHRGQLKISEVVDDVNQRMEIVIYLPLADPSR